MDTYKEKEAAAGDDNILSLSDLQMDEDTISSSKEVNSTNIFYQDFFGVSGEQDWSRQLSNENSPVKQPMTTDDKFTKPATTKMDRETNPMFRSNSGSFRYMRFKIGSSSSGSWRSRSLSVMASKSKSRWQVFMSGFGSGKFPGKMDLRDIKTRQVLYSSQSTTTTTMKVCQDVDDHQVGREQDSGGRRRTGGKKAVWWRLVYVLGCGGCYKKDTMVVV